MPIGGIKPKTVVNKGSATNASGSGGPSNGGRTTFRPPWVKADNPETTAKSVTTTTTTKPNPVWMRKTEATKENGQTKTVPTPIAPNLGAPRKEVKLQSREIKVPIMTEKPKPVQVPLKPHEKVVKPPSPEESEEESEESEEETETESESEEEESEEETELEKTFKINKTRSRPVVVKRDKSFISTKKTADAEAAAQEEEERQRRFKLERPKLRHVVVNKEKPLTNKSTDDFGKIRPVLKKVPKIDENKTTSDTEPAPEFKDKVLKKVPPIKRNDSIVNNVPVPPPLPSLIPKPPPPPPLQLAPPTDFEKKQLSDKQKKVIDKLKTRPRKRPDWSEMMKEVESGRKLKHVECNDRSKPIITCKSMTKVDDKFVYETEKANAHNILLKQIQSGVRLKPTKTNDRSRPILDGLRKFRRQMTIEEQIQKSESKAVLFEASNESPPVESSEDDMDDIDKLRDDLQSTKQLLALELRNREAQERENKRLLSRIANLEAELQREKTKLNNETGNQSSTKGAATVDEALVNSLKEDAAEARKSTKELEKKYQDTAEELDIKKNEVEEQKRQIASLEKKLSLALQGRVPNNNSRPKLSFCYSYEEPFDRQVFYTWDQGGSGLLSSSRRASEAQPNKESSPEIELESESEEEEDEEKKAAKAAKRLTREVKLLRLKLTKLKDKQVAAKKERTNLKDTMKKTQLGLKAENKKFKKLEKEVQKMAASMKEEESDEEKDEEEEEEEAEEEQEEESEEESESEESEEESGSDSESESEDESATDEAKKNNLEPRVKRYENRLSALKKGNYLLQANVDNLQDEINKVKEKANSLQRELDAVIADLGL